jgi:hypothetical protein
MTQYEYMAKNAAVTIRLTEDLKTRLQLRARRAHRSLSAQVVNELETVAAGEVQPPGQGHFLGLYEGGVIPSDDDIQHVRSLLWGKLRGRRLADG